MPSHISSVVSCSFALAATPALFTRISGSPSAFRTRATIASTCWRSPTSQRTASARRPVVRIASTTSDSSLSDRAATATSAPAAARDSATARPIPRPPPVTNATRPDSSATLVLAQDLGQLGRIDIATGHDAGDPAVAHLPGHGHCEGGGPGTLGDHAVPLGHQPDGRRDLVEAGGEGPVEQLLGHNQHVREDRLAADAVDP